VAVSEQDVRHIAALARLGVSDARLPSLVGELNHILEHMAVLEKVDTTTIDPADSVGSVAMPLRADTGPQLPLARSRDSFAPAVKDGFLLVPRLATHSALGASAAAAAEEDADELEVIE
jgi:aspartyl-tRNA(Asn)/glutamyl-tRNA(Gln) amidotransferase subunit C